LYKFVKLNNNTFS